jgi:hypothetical protein
MEEITGEIEINVGPSTWIQPLTAVLEIKSNCARGIGQLPSHLLAVTPAAAAHRTRDLAAPTSRHGRRSSEWEDAKSPRVWPGWHTGKIGRQWKDYNRGAWPEVCAWWSLDGGACAVEHGRRLRGARGQREKGGRLGRWGGGEGMSGSHGEIFYVALFLWDKTDG